MGRRAGQKKRASTRRSMADRADPYDLYQQSVQCVEAEIDFVDDTYRTLRRRRAKLLREDFCGAGNTSCEWVARRKENRAYGVDIDPEVLAWGQRHNVPKLGHRQDHLSLLQADVRDATIKGLDVILAMNFSYWLFKDRNSLRTYFKSVRHSLTPDGIFFLDAYGGYDCNKVAKDRHKHDGFTYIWDQAQFDPISHSMECHIHFRFSDGSRLERAFSYEWRLWGLPEITELLEEAGFGPVTIYWQGTDKKTGEADGVFKPATRGEPDPAWIVYIVAENRGQASVQTEALE